MYFKFFMAGFGWIWLDLVGFGWSRPFAAAAESSDSPVSRMAAQWVAAWLTDFGWPVCFQLERFYFLSCHASEYAIEPASGYVPQEHNRRATCGALKSEKINFS